MIAWLMATVLAAMPPNVRVTTLSEETIAGSLKEFTGTTITVDVAGTPRVIPQKDLKEIILDENDAPPAEAAATMTLTLNDTSQIGCTQFTATGQKLTASVTGLGELALGRNAIRSVRFAELSPKVAARWDELSVRDAQTDLVVIRKGDALDFVVGTLSEIQAEKVEILVKSKAVVVPRDRVFGLVFGKSNTALGKPVCEVITQNGNKFRLQTVAVTGLDTLTGKTATGIDVKLPLSTLKKIDFTLGRIRYLADLPEEAEYKSEGLVRSEFVLQVRKNRTSGNTPLKLAGNVEFTRGLWIHSGTTLKYRLNREFRRFVTTAGVDRSSPACDQFQTSVRLIVTGDGKSLLNREFQWNDAPAALELDVGGVRDLTIQVEPIGKTSGICEHLDLGDARVVQ